MPIEDKLAALLLVTVWGVNFVVIKLGLRDVPPLLLGALRFALVAFPAILFVPRPRIPLSLLLAYATTIGFAQFAFLFTAIYVGMPAGLASLVLQVQVFMTLALAALTFGERMERHNFVGLAIAFSGLALLAAGSAARGSFSLPGFALSLLAALSWAAGNIVNKKIGRVNLIGLVAWSGLVPIIPFLIASSLIEGVPAIELSLTHFSFALLAAVAYLAFGASLVGYTLWGRLITRYPAWKVAPLTLLVPVVGMATAWAVLGESLSITQATGAAIILAGLLVNIFGARFVRPQPATASRP